MLIAALALAVIGLVALVTAVVTGNEVVAWACIAASSLGVILLVIDAIRERQRSGSALGAAGAAELTEPGPEVAELSESTAVIEGETPDAETLFVEEQIALEDHPEEVVHEEPEYDTYSDDEPEYPPPAEESALHTVGETGQISGDDEIADEIAEEVAGEVGRPDQR
jgi:hypothetical protein